MAPVLKTCRSPPDVMDEYRAEFGYLAQTLYLNVTNARNQENKAILPTTPTTPTTPRPPGSQGPPGSVPQVQVGQFRQPIGPGIVRPSTPTTPTTPVAGQKFVVLSTPSQVISDFPY